MPTLRGVESIGNLLPVFANFWDLSLFLGLLANSLVQLSLPQKSNMLLPLVVADSYFGSHTRGVTMVRSVPMYLSCVIARVPLVFPKPRAPLKNQTHRGEVPFLRDNVEKGNIDLIHVPTKK
jgi:hypothetical protein